MPQESSVYCIVCLQVCVLACTLTCRVIHTRQRDLHRVIQNSDSCANAHSRNGTRVRVEVTYIYTGTPFALYIIHDRLKKGIKKQWRPGRRPLFGLFKKSPSASRRAVPRRKRAKESAERQEAQSSGGKGITRGRSKLPPRGRKSIRNRHTPSGVLLLPRNALHCLKRTLSTDGSP